MKNRILFLHCWVLVLASLVTNSYSADGPTRPPAAKIAETADVAWQRRLPEIDLGDNLPLGEVARNLGAIFPAINFIVPVSGRDEPVPKLRLRNVTLGDILKVIELASEGRIRASMPGETHGSEATGLASSSASDRLGDNIVAFRIGSVPGTAAALPSAAVCRVFSLAPYLAGRSEKEAQRAAKELYAAIDVAWDMLRKQDRDVQLPNLTYHEGTRLLIAVGREKDLLVIDQIVRQLSGAAPHKVSAVPAVDEKESEELRKAVQQLQRFLESHPAPGEPPPTKR